VSQPRLPGRVLALTPGDLTADGVADLVRKVREAAGAGLDSILLREPALSDRATLELALELRDLLGETGWLGIHDRVHLASVAGADAVHLGFRSLPIREARAICAESIALGFSAHAHDVPEAWDGADYLTFGPVFATPSKFGLVEPVGVDGLLQAVRSTSIPIFALGGIGAENAGALAATGCRGIAVRSAWMETQGTRARWLDLVRSSR